MFGRKLEVNVVKEKKPLEVGLKPEDNIDHAALYSAAISTTVENVGKIILQGILVVIAADTARQVIVKRTKER